MKWINSCVPALALLGVISCGSSGSLNGEASNQPAEDKDKTQSEQQESSHFTAIKAFSLEADGPEQGASAYQLIEQVFGRGSIESPDMYSNDHTDVVHIIEDHDEIVGNHFVFLAHRDLDLNKGVASDRQRNEIKAYDKSNSDLLAFEGETFQYRWKFKVSSELELSSKFTHFFQLKAKNASESFANGNDNQPIITLSGAEASSSGNELQVRYSKGHANASQLLQSYYMARLNWDVIVDEWVEVFVQATYAEQGELIFEITRLRDNNKVLAIHEQDIDLLRANDAGDFVRPKWGIYRSIAETASLRADEEQVRFANFSIIKGVIDK
ncbi:hypothetical protein DS2_03385 [Catenovulum agarivorans DS-2]|uniref:Uncharacterized protein n=1 Tax=Catenovulum agarivorans DS-2 TaxID=1328313 RepID=W7QF50_9ALTE|nr:heparin lyase I family protein [Catenovulum agarivorans]EWH11519.1 hypothetical protein DS2_03385 [Catenovulum agarivorans DS-2]